MYIHIWYIYLIHKMALCWFHPWKGKQNVDFISEKVKKKKCWFHPWKGEKNVDLILEKVKKKCWFHPWKGKKKCWFHPWKGKKKYWFHPWKGKKNVDFIPEKAGVWKYWNILLVPRQVIWKKLLVRTKSYLSCFFFVFFFL